MSRPGVSSVSQKCTNQYSVYQLALGLPISVPRYTPAKTPLGGATFQSAYLVGGGWVSVWVRSNACVTTSTVQIAEGTLRS